MRVFVTGATGFIGQHLTRELRQHDYEVVQRDFDITSFDDTSTFLNDLQDHDTVVHLAGLAAPGDCERDPHRAFDVNVTGTLHLLEAILRVKKKAHVIFASTGHVYSPGATGPLREDSLIEPLNLYGRTKRAAEVLLQDWAVLNHQRVTILRLFNHSHKSQAPNVFLPSLYQKILAAKADGSSSVTVGNLDLYRDIGSLSDLMAAFLAVFKSPGEIFQVFNVCSGTPKLLRNLAERLRDELEAKLDFRTDEKLLRHVDPKTIVGDSSLLQHKTGWRPTCLTEADVIQQFFK